MPDGSLTMPEEIFYVAFRLGNDAFGHTPERDTTADEMRPEIVRILRAAADHIEVAGRYAMLVDPLRAACLMPLRDINGNTVGYAGVKDKTPPLIWEGLNRLADGH